MDGLRMLPFLCGLLWVVVPAMWPNGAQGDAATPLSSALGYLFGIWLLAIAASFALWRRLRGGIGDANDDDSTKSAGG